MVGVDCLLPFVGIQDYIYTVPGWQMGVNIRLGIIYLIPSLADPSHQVFCHLPLPASWNIGKPWGSSLEAWGKL